MKGLIVKGLLGLLVLLVVGGIYWTVEKAKTGHLEDEIREDFFKKRTGAEFIDKLRTLYQKGNEEQQTFAKQALMTITLDKKTYGSFTASGVVATLEADDGAPNQVKFTPLKGLGFFPQDTLWGERSGIGVQETKVWAKWVLANDTSKPITVHRSMFVVYGGDNYKQANYGLGLEPDGGRVSLPAKAILDSASLFNTITGEPEYLEFNDGSVIARQGPRATGGIMNLHGRYERDASYWPGGNSADLFPVRKPFSTQIKSGPEAKKFLEKTRPKPKAPPAEAAPADGEAPPATAPVADADGDSAPPVAAVEPPPAPPAASAAPPAAAPIDTSAPRTFISNRGEKVEAILISFDGQSVTIRRTADKQVFTMPISRFSEADQRWLHKTRN